MLNQFVLVGRLTKEPTQVNEGKAIINIAVARSFKNENGEYETDTLDIVVHNAMAQNTCEYCHKGNVVGVKGRIQSHDEIGIGINFVAEKITYLSSNTKNEKD